MSLPDDPLRESQAAADATPQAEVPRRDTETPSGPAAAPSSMGWTWLLVLAAGLLAGLAGFAIGEVAPKLVPPSFELSPEIRRNRNQIPIELERRAGISRDRAATIAYGGLGAVLGLALGTAGGLGRRSARAAIAAGVTGLVLGGAAGAGTTKALLPSYHAGRDTLASVGERPEQLTNDLGLALRTHGGIWIAVGAAAGLALGLGLGGGARTARAVFGGVLGGVIASAIYEYGGAIIFPLAETFRPMAVTAAPRLLAHLSVALCVSLAAFWSANYLRLRRAPPRTNH
jgi:hypothetical protein